MNTNLPVKHTDPMDPCRFVIDFCQNDLSHVRNAALALYSRPTDVPPWRPNGFHKCEKFARHIYAFAFVLSERISFILINWRG